MTYKIAHFSDLHLGLDEDDFDRTEFLLGHALAQGANHIVVTGDLLDHGNHDDIRWFKASLRRLDLWNPKRTTVVPGNHDVIGGTNYSNRFAALIDSSSKRAQRKQIFTRAFAPLEQGVRRVGRSRFPYVKQLGPVAMIGVDSVDTEYFSQGLVGEEQTSRLSQLLKSLKRGRAMPIVAIHHRPIDVPSDDNPWKYRLFRGLGGGTMNLADADAVIDAIAKGGGTLVLCGHWHVLDDHDYYDRVSGVRVFTQGRSGGMDQQEEDDDEIYYSYDMLTFRAGAVHRETIEFEVAEIDAELE